MPTTMVSVAPLLREPVYPVMFTELELIVITVDEELAVTPIACRLVLLLIAEARPDAMLVKVSVDRTV